MCAMGCKLPRYLYAFAAIFLLASPCISRADDGAQQDSQSQQSSSQAPEDLTQVPQDSPQTRERPGEEPKLTRVPPYLYEAVPDINSSASDFVPVPDRWSQFYIGKWYDPYNQNILKGDLPVFGSQAAPWFVELTGISDSTAEYRRLPIPVGTASTQRPGEIDTFGNGQQFVFEQNVIFSFSIYNGDTTFKPQEFEFRVTPHFNYNYAHADEDGVLRVDPGLGDTRDDEFLGFDELFGEVHIANISERYDFVSSRIGIQRFSSDFRGFIFNDEAPGARLFGNFDNNIYQWNTAWFYRLNKDTNSGINKFQARHEQVLVANLYRQDTLVHGHTAELSVLHSEDLAGEAGDLYDNNGFLVRPSPLGDEQLTNESVTYLGLTGDGHFDRINTTEALYYAFGSESHDPIAERHVDISAAMAALEVSYDMDWTRFRGSFFWASGDSNPNSGEAHGFDSIFDNPNFAGGDLSFWQREGIPLIGGGGVNLVGPNSFLPDLKPNKGLAQSEFVNPGLLLYNAGVDFDVTPKIKWINNVSFMQFATPAVLRELRQQDNIGRNIGFDLSSGLSYRPFLNNNIQIRVGAATLLPGDGTEDLFKHQALYDVFTDLIFQY